MLKGGAAVAALGMAAMFGGLTSPAAVDAASDLRAALLQIPSVGKGSPTHADWQNVGELCLGTTKANVKEDEFDNEKTGCVLK
jgi:multiple sugar transport system substrate-binding protein